MKFDTHSEIPSINSPLGVVVHQTILYNPFNKHLSQNQNQLYSSSIEMMISFKDCGPVPSIRIATIVLVLQVLLPHSLLSAHQTDQHRLRQRSTDFDLEDQNSNLPALIQWSDEKADLDDYLLNYPGGDRMNVHVRKTLRERYFIHLTPSLYLLCITILNVDRLCTTSSCLSIKTLITNLSLTLHLSTIDCTDQSPAPSFYNLRNTYNLWIWITLIVESRRCASWRRVTYPTRLKMVSFSMKSKNGTMMSTPYSSTSKTIHTLLLVSPRWWWTQLSFSSLPKKKLQSFLLMTDWQSHRLSHTLLDTKPNLWSHHSTEIFKSLISD